MSRGIAGPPLRAVLASLVLLVSASDASAFHISLRGVVTDYFSGAPLKDVRVRLVKDGIERETIVTGRKGTYELYLERGYEYLVSFQRDDRVTKELRIDAREIPLFPDVAFFDMDVQVGLFAPIEGFGIEAFGEPLALAAYKHSIRNLSWDTEFTDSRKAELAPVMARYEREAGALRHKGPVEGSVVKRWGKKRKRKMVLF